MSNLQNILFAVDDLSEVPQLLEKAKRMLNNRGQTQSDQIEDQHQLSSLDNCNLLRNSEVPVLSASTAQWSAKPIIVAAVDACDTSHAELNQRILSCAHALSEQFTGDLHIVCVYPLISPWMDQISANQNSENLSQQMRGEITQYVSSICQTLSISDYTLHASEGLAEFEIEKTLRALKTSLLVIGTNRRDGPAGQFLSNTAEQLVQASVADTLVVP